MKVKEYLETLHKYDQVTMILKRQEYRSEGMPDHLPFTVHSETPIRDAEEWLESTSDVLDKEILAFDFPTLTPVWHTQQKLGRLRVILVNCLPYPITPPGEDFLNRRGK